MKISKIIFTTLLQHLRIIGILRWKDVFCFPFMKRMQCLMWNCLLKPGMNLQKKNGLKGFYFIALSIALPKIDAQNINNLDGYIEKRFAEYLKMGFDGVNSINLKYAELKAGNPVKQRLLMDWLDALLLGLLSKNMTTKK